MSRLLRRSGKVTFLRVHDVGTGWGPPDDQLADVETIIRLDSAPDQAFGFGLRDDRNRVAREGMLNLLRDAFNNGWNVTVDYRIDEGKRNGTIIRTELTRS